jgi:type I restriction enzyme M protein
MPGGTSVAFDLAELEARLWAAADELRANSTLKASEYSVPVLGLIFLKFAEVRFLKAQRELADGPTTGRRSVGPVDFKARGVLYLPPEARFEHLLHLPEGADIGRALVDAMEAIEEANEDLRGVLPRSYASFENRMLVELLKLMNSILNDVTGDAFGLIYEYFLGKFAMTEGQKGGEFFTPSSIVRLIVEIIEPFHGRIYDPACGSGGMFVQSARFVERHALRPADELSVFGQERVAETVRLAKMNLAVHGLAGDIREANSYYDDAHNAVGAFDFVMANPPFNVNRVDRDRLRDETARFPFGVPTADNANYLWIQLFYSSLSPSGRAGFVMANSAGDARGSEMEIRRQLIEAGAVDVVVAVGANFFYTVILPVSLWFLDRGKVGTPRADTILFIDARPIFRQVNRALRDFTDEQIEFVSNVARLYRGEAIGDRAASTSLMALHFPGGAYVDVPGLCRVATRAEVAAQGWSLNPGRYVGVGGIDGPRDDFGDRLEELGERLAVLNSQSHALEDAVSASFATLAERQ